MQVKKYPVEFQNICICVNHIITHYMVTATIIIITTTTTTTTTTIILPYNIYGTCTACKYIDICYISILTMSNMIDVLY